MFGAQTSAFAAQTGLESGGVRLRRALTNTPNLLPTHYKNAEGVLSFSLGFSRKPSGLPQVSVIDSPWARCPAHAGRRAVPMPRDERIPICPCLAPLPRRSDSARRSATKAAAKTGRTPPLLPVIASHCQPSRETTFSLLPGKNPRIIGQIRKKWQCHLP